MSGQGVTVELPGSLVEAVAGRVVELLEQRLAPAGADDPWMDVDQAADYLACKPQRIHDLVSLGRLSYDGRDGRRGLFRRSTLDAYVEEQAASP